jgi:peptidoglycan/xylan/chitin deacetylase (PgdA/CDA1 family)
MSQPGIFNISLDFELHWGCFESSARIFDNKAEQYFKNTRKAIPGMLSIFKANELHVTWAIVGMLYRHSQTEWEQNQPHLIPTFSNPDVSAYEWIKKNGFNSENDPYHFAPDLIDQIQAIPHMEIGTHTYAHYFCLEPGQTKEQFREDIRMAVALAESRGIAIKSLVFPRNQFNSDYLSVCSEFGITSVRTNPDIWYWSYSNSAGSFWKRFFRAGDAYLKIYPIKMVKVQDIQLSNHPLHLPASRLYRAWRPKYALENKLKMKRILDEMTKAAKKGGYYHLWWHPHNFGYHPDECLQELGVIANHFNQLREQYGFETLTMQETTDKLRSLKK